MTIEEIARSKLVEEIVNNTAKHHSEDPLNLQDLCQDIYIILLEKEDTVKPLNAKETKYYISRIACNNIRSKNSRYYYKYKKKQELEMPLEVWARREEDNDKNNNDV